MFDSRNDCNVDSQTEPTFSSGGFADDAACVDNGPDSPDAYDRPAYAYTFGPDHPFNNAEEAAAFEVYLEEERQKTAALARIGSNARTTDRTRTLASIPHWPDWLLIAAVSAADDAGDEDILAAATVELAGRIDAARDEREMADVGCCRCGGVHDGDPSGNCLKCLLEMSLERERNRQRSPAA